MGQNDYVASSKPEQCILFNNEQGSFKLQFQVITTKTEHTLHHLKQKRGLAKDEKHISYIYHKEFHLLLSTAACA